ncbi:hypothetical protein NTHI1209_00263 [Haemophilus influenzae]|uniref:Uncharacterized protein n=1 Tax=Haemophilus influenzae TaxID=727 RepID=A0A158SUW7_HAEIF|nr:hypothetical protein NTHI1209_00263 [Haemophilus influenzae]
MHIFEIYKKAFCQNSKIKPHFTTLFEKCGYNLSYFRLFKKQFLVNYSSLSGTTNISILIVFIT